MSEELSERGAASGSALELDLETALPGMLVGRATAVFLYGTCSHPESDLASLQVLVDGTAHRVDAFAMPRLEKPVYRSGFWATVPIPAPAAPASIELALEARLAGGGRAGAVLGQIEVTERGTPPALEIPGPAGRGLIVICMATFEPDIDLFEVQIESIRAQTDANWHCLLSDDCSAPDRFAEIEAVIAGDRRFGISRSQRRLGIYRNFERALEMVPEEAELVALCDQDDRWHPDKLATLRGAIGRAGLVYSDQRLITADGSVLAETYWTTRRNNHTNISSLLIANSITGAASLIRREIVDLALPFPQAPGEQYHDHWLGLVALATGRVGYVDRPLYDYVQHGTAVLGHAAANVEIPGSAGGGPWARLRRARRSFKDWAAAYFNGYARVRVVAEALLARCEGRISGRKRRALRRMIAAEHSPPAFAWLALRPVRRRFGRNETLGLEKVLSRGILWRVLLGLRTRRQRRPEGFPYDASIPPLDSRVAGPAAPDSEVARIEQKIAPLELAVDERAPERVNLLIPTIDLEHLFGGYIAKLNLARRLAESGLRTRIVTVDPTPPLPPTWRQRIESYSGLDGALEKVEVAFAREGDRPLEISPNDSFIATTWWTAHVAAAALESTRRSRFLYLIQEYEPFTFPMGSWAALAMESYRLPHAALFSTTLLRDFFAAHGYGVFAAGKAAGERDSASFRNAITAVRAPSIAELGARSSRRLLFYARPERHGARNMFELGMISLSGAIERGVFGPEWEFFGIGTVGGEERIPLGAGAALELLNRRSQAGYAELLPAHDVGLSLMLTPHPSLVPIEMASAAMPTVTNSFETKTPEAMRAISANLIAGDPTPEGVIGGLAAAVAASADHEARVEGAAVNWSADWDDSFNPDLVARITSLLAES